MEPRCTDCDSPGPWKTVRWWFRPRWDGKPGVERVEIRQCAVCRTEYSGQFVVPMEGTGVAGKEQP